MTPLQNVLCVEDDPDIRMVAQLALEAVGKLRARLCSGGAEAIAALGEFKPDLILIDVMMPEMDGPETIAAIRALPGFSDIPFIFLTAKVQPPEVTRLRALGAADVIAKPFDPMKLAAHLKATWEALHAGRP